MARPLKHTLPDGTLTQGESLVLPVKGEPLASFALSIAGPTVRTASGTGDALGKYLFTISTSGWGVGMYIWEIMQTYADAESGQTVTARIERQRFYLAASVSSMSAGAVVATTAQKAVWMLEQSLSGNATAEVQQYKINNRELRRYPIPERLQLLAFWRREVQRERRVASGKSSLGSGIKVSF